LIDAGELAVLHFCEDLSDLGLEAGPVRLAGDTEGRPLPTPMTVFQRPSDASWVAQPDVPLWLMGLRLRGDAKPACPTARAQRVGLEGTLTFLAGGADGVVFGLADGSLHRYRDGSTTPLTRTSTVLYRSGLVLGNRVWFGRADGRVDEAQLEPFTRTSTVRPFTRQQDVVALSSGPNGTVYAIAVAGEIAQRDASGRWRRIPGSSQGVDHVERWIVTSSKGETLDLGGGTLRRRLSDGFRDEQLAGIGEGDRPAPSTLAVIAGEPILAVTSRVTIGERWLSRYDPASEIWTPFDRLDISVDDVGVMADLGRHQATRCDAPKTTLGYFGSGLFATHSFGDAPCPAVGVFDHAPEWLISVDTTTLVVGSRDHDGLLILRLN